MLYYQVWLSGNIFGLWTSYGPRADRQTYSLSAMDVTTNARILWQICWATLLVGGCWRLARLEGTMVHRHSHWTTRQKQRLRRLASRRMRNLYLYINSVHACVKSLKEVNYFVNQWRRHVNDMSKMKFTQFNKFQMEEKKRITRPTDIIHKACSIGKNVHAPSWEKLRMQTNGWTNCSTH